MIVVSNAGPLMALGKLGCVKLLAPLYGQVLVPRVVHEEVVTRGLLTGHPDARETQAAVLRGELVVLTMEEPLLPEIINLPLDAGEKHALQLARREEADLVLLDDLRARQEAKQLNLTVKGTLGVLTAACRAGHLKLSEMELLIEDIIQRNDIWIAEAVCRQVLAALKTEAERA